VTGHTDSPSYGGTRCAANGQDPRSGRRRGLPRLGPDDIHRGEDDDVATKQTTQGSSDGWTDEERAAMKERAAELRGSGTKGAAKAAEEAQACLDKIAEMPDSDRVMAERIHAVVTEAAPDLAVKTWYGMPAYARDGKVVCFFKPAGKFKSRYATLGFEDAAALDDGTMWATSFALTAVTAADEKKIKALVKKAAS
jgi:uncharacterized protein YdhG (YjbR/CyaY superfamily)